MGNPTASCLKIIACGSDSVGDGDLQISQTNSSSDRRRWSFQKRSARHRVLSSNTISEAAPSANKESPDSAPVNFQEQHSLIVLEKTSINPLTEGKNTLSAFLKSKLPDSTRTGEDNSRAVATIDESNIIVIQAAIRRCLAQRGLMKQKNIIKLQAVVRGQLVRRHAVGSLRCVQAIVKMQALVRAHQARRLLPRSCDLEKNENSAKKSEGAAKPNTVHAYISIEKLLSNSFARQLMESTPRRKPINFKCEPLKPDSSWKWLERWMSVSAVGIKDPHESESVVEQLEENIVHSDCKEGISVPSVCYSESREFKSGVGAPDEAFENDDSLITYDTNNMNLQLCKVVSLPSSHSELLNIDVSGSRNDEKELVPTKTKETGLNLKVESKPHLIEETGNEHDTSDRDKISVEQLETEAIIDAHSKFEDPTSDSTSAKLKAPSYYEPGVESNLDTFSLSIDHPFVNSKIGLAENSISNSSAVHISDSECGTELSITSTLDSPDRSEVAFNDLELEPKLSNMTEHTKSGEDLGLEANEKSSIRDIHPSHTGTNRLEKVDFAPDECVSSVISEQSPRLEKNPDTAPHNLQLELSPEPSQLVQKSSPEASPRSYVTVPESQATPSSKVTVRPKRCGGEKSESNKKNRSSLSDETSGSKTNQDSPSRNTVEPLQKDHKYVKRRNSFSSSKPDHADHEPRVSSGSNSLPSYMQATESAKAKAIVNGSPRSSLDTRDKDTYTRRRDSLPGTNGRQGSQAKLNAKGNDNHSHQERKWRR